MQAWKECSERLITEGELDPTYNLLVHAKKVRGELWAKRFALAHLMFYNVETSLTLAGAGEEHFWFRVLRNYHDWPRGQERRHYRAKNGLDSITSMQNEEPTEVFDIPLRGGSIPSLKTVSWNIQHAGFLGFGIYFQMKWADFLDVIHRASIDYSPMVNRPGTFLFEGAGKGLDSIWSGRPHHESLLEIVDYIKQWRDPFQGYRLCGLSEAETIACAYRTYYVKKHYKFGWDINNLRTTLARLNQMDLAEGLPPITKEWT